MSSKGTYPVAQGVRRGGGMSELERDRAIFDLLISFNFQIKNEES